MVLKRWSEREIGVLRDLYKNYNQSEIAKKLNRSKNAIHSKSRELKLYKKHQFTKKDDDYLKINYPNRNIPIDTLCKKLNISFNSLDHRINRLRLKRRNDYLTKKEIRFVNQNYGKKTYKQICELLDKKFNKKRTTHSLCSILGRIKKRLSYSKIRKMLYKNKAITNEEILGKCQLSPNNLEKKFMYFLNKNFPNEWRFCGNFKLFIENVNPDFIHLQKNIVIECYEDYFKKLNYGSAKKYVNLRKNHFKRCGYIPVFVHWKDFNKNPNLIRDKLVQILSK